jgi:hypothetical protein
MRAQRLILLLEKAIAERGNLEVFVHFDDSQWILAVQGLEIATVPDGYEEWFMFLDKGIVLSGSHYAEDGNFYGNFKWERIDEAN